MRVSALISFLALSFAPMAQAKDLQIAVFAGGCFWCVEADMDKIPGVVDTVSGFTGGNVAKPSYKQVTKGNTGHYEAVRVTFDSDVTSYPELVAKFLRSVDPLDGGGQFCDRGEHYSTAIFATTPQQANWAEKAISDAEAQLGQPIKTVLRMAKPFYAAEEYHQDYYKSSKIVLTRFGPLSKAEAYKRYRKGCGRDKRVRQVWGQAAFPGT